LLFGFPKLNEVDEFGVLVGGFWPKPKELCPVEVVEVGFCPNANPEFNVEVDGEFCPKVNPELLKTLGFEVDGEFCPKNPVFVLELVGFVVDVEFCPKLNPVLELLGLLVFGAGFNVFCPKVNPVLELLGLFNCEFCPKEIGVLFVVLGVLFRPKLNPVLFELVGLFDEFCPKLKLDGEFCPKLNPVLVVLGAEFDVLCPKLINPVLVELFDAEVGKLNPDGLVELFVDPTVNPAVGLIPDVVVLPKLDPKENELGVLEFDMGLVPD